MQSRVIRMVYFERQTQKQVAERLALPVTTISRAVATGMQALAGSVATTARRME